MKNKKGFTLVELLGVFTLIGVVLLLVVPNVTQMLNRAKNDDYDRFLNDLFLATEAYIESDQQQIENLKLVGGKSFIKIEDMIYAGYLRSTIVNPKTNQKIDPNSTMVALRSPSGKITYDYVEEMLSEGAYVQNGLQLHHDSFEKPIDGTWKNLGKVGSSSTLNGFHENNGFRGSQVDFDGTNYVSCGLVNYDYITVSAYFLIPEATTGEQIVLSNYEDGGYGIVYDQSNNNKIAFQIYAAGAYQRVTAPTDYELNTWYHVTGTYDGSTLKLYINGSLVGTQAVSGTIRVPVSNTYLMLATNPSGANATAKYKPSIRSVMVYDHALTEAEIKQNYELDQKRYSTNADRYVKDGLILQLDGYQKPNGTVWNDLSGNGNHATLANFAVNSYQDKRLQFDGSDDYIEFGNQFVDLFKSSMTFEIVALFEDGKVRTILFGNYPQTNSIAIEKGYENQQGRIWYQNGAVNYFTSTDCIAIDKIQTSSFLLNKEKQTFYFYHDSKLKDQVTNAKFKENFDFTNPRIGSDFRTDRQAVTMKGNLYAVRIYNRALTQEELDHNYQLDRLRFGI